MRGETAKAETGSVRMVKIQGIGDVNHSDIPECIKQYLIKYIQSILSTYQTITLQKFGCVYFLENRQDTQSYRKMGLRLPLQDAPFEYGEMLRLKDSRGEIDLLHGCYVFNNDFAIDIFGERDIFTDGVIRSLLDV